jgi:ADP-ribosylglycohydrolase
LLELAEESAKCTHAHPEGIAGARAVVYCVWAVRNCVKKEAIYEYLKVPRR